MKAELIYLAGPYRGSCAAEVKRNITIAEAHAMHLWHLGYPTICPHLNSAFFDGCTEDKIFLEGYLRILESCDAMVLLDGWEDSQGTLGEIFRANNSFIPIYKSIEDLIAGRIADISIKPKHGETSKVNAVTNTDAPVEAES